MLGINSSVKNITERLNPLSQRNKISKLKFERKKDYKTFLDFIKKNTKEIEGTGVDDVKEKLSKGVLGLGGVGILAALFGGGSGLDPVGEGNTRFNTLQNVIRKRKADAKKFNKKGKKKVKDLGDITKLSKSAKRKIEDIESIRGPARERIKKVRKAYKIKLKEALERRKKSFTQRKIEKKFFKFSDAQKNLNQEATKEIGGDTNINKKSTTKTRAKVTPSGDPINIEQRQFADRNRLGLQDDIENFQKIDLGAEEQIKEAKKIKLQDKLKIKSDIRKDRQEKGNRASNVLDDLEADSARRAAIEDRQIRRDKFLKFNRRVDKILNSRFAKGIEKVRRIVSGEEFVEGAIKIIARNPKLFKSLGKKGAKRIPIAGVLLDFVFPDALGDGTLESVMDVNGKLPGQEGYDEKTKGQFSQPVNIFLNNDQSMIPFNPDLKFNNDVIPPTDFPTPSSNIFIDPKQQLNIDDIFFLRSFSGG